METGRHLEKNNNAESKKATRQDGLHIYLISRLKKH